MLPYITFRPVNPPSGASVRAQLGNGFATPTADGGWQVVARMRQMAMTEWQGPQPIVMDVPILLDGLATNTSVEPAIQRLYEIMREPVGDKNQPAVVKIDGVPIPFAGLHWVINGITPSGDPEGEIRRAHDGARIRAAMSVSVQQYVPGDIVTHGTKSSKSSPSKTNRHRTKPKSHGKGSGNTPPHFGGYVRAKTGDTLSVIAARELGASSRWVDIAAVNNIRDPHNVKPGQKIKLP